MKFPFKGMDEEENIRYIRLPEHKRLKAIIPPSKCHSSRVCDGRVVLFSGQDSSVSPALLTCRNTQLRVFFSDNLRDFGVLTVTSILIKLLSSPPG